MPILDQIETAIPSLRRYALGLTGDRDMADDLVQDTLERAVARRQSWRATGPVQAWLFRILLNRYRDTLRRRPAHLVAVEDLPVEPARPGGQEGHMALAEVKAAIDALPPDQRAALLLVTVEGMSFDEAAQLLDIPVGTLMSRLGRARETLRTRTGRPRPARRPAKESHTP